MGIGEDTQVTDLSGLRRVDGSTGPADAAEGRSAQ